MAQPSVQRVLKAAEKSGLDCLEDLADDLERALYLAIEASDPIVYEMITLLHHLKAADRLYGDLIMVCNEHVEAMVEN